MATALMQAALLLAAAHLGGRAARRLGQPAVMGELLAGVLLGPCAAGQNLPGLRLAAFLPISGAWLEPVSWLGLVLFMLYTGLETDAECLRRLRRPAFFASLGGMALPFFLGAGLAWTAPSDLVGPAAGRGLFALFMGTAVAISAIPVIARILRDLGLLRGELGTVIVSAALADDTAGWIILAALAAAAGGGGAAALAQASLFTLAFILACVWVLRPLARAGFGLLEGPGWRVWAARGAALALALACAGLTQAMGIHAVFGAFAAGVVMSGCAAARAACRGGVERLVMGLIVPLFFAGAGLKVSLAGFGEPLWPALFVAAACLGKIAGGSLGARLGGMAPREALAVGVGLNARGAMELVIASVGLSLGMLNQASYSIVVLIALVTTAMTPALLRWALARPALTAAPSLKGAESLRA